MRQKRKINDEILLQMVKGGKTGKECAAFFNCSEPAISKKLKRLQAMQPPESLQALSGKERQFALQVAGGKSFTAAAYDTYECRSRASAKSLGSQIAGKPEVKTAINDLLEQYGAGREFRIKKLSEHMRHVDPVVSLKAIDIGLELSGDKTESKRQVTPYSYIEVHLVSDNDLASQEVIVPQEENHA